MVATFEINGTEIVTQGADIIAISSAVNDIGDIKTRGGVWSNTFKIPYCAVNAGVFGTPEQVLTDNLNFYKQLPLVVKVEGNPIVFGFAELESASYRYYEVRMFAGNADWTSKVLDKKLSDIDISELSHLYTEANVYGNRTNTHVDGFIYPNVDYGLITSTPPATITYDKLWPALFVRYLFKRILEYTGYEMDGKLLDLEMFNEEVLTYNGEGENHSQRWTDKFSCKAVMSTPQALDPTPPTFIKSILDDDSISGYDGDGDNWNVSTYEFTDTEPMLATINYFVEMEHISDIEVIARVVKDVSGTVTDITPSGGLLMGDIGTVYPFFRNFTISDYLLNPGDKVYVLVSSATGTSGPSSVNVIHSELEIKAQDDFVLGSEFEMNHRFGQIKCVDVLRLVFNQYAVMNQADNYNKITSLNQFDNVAENIYMARDWSEKIDMTENPSVTAKLGNYGQNSLFKYSPDELDPFFEKNPEYGQGTIMIDNLRLDTEKVVFETPFGAIRRAPTMTGILEMAFMPLYDSAGDMQRCLTRVGYISRNGDNLIIIGGNPTEGIQPAVYFDGMDFQSLIDTHYETLTGMLYRLKVLTIAVRLTASDMATLDHAVPVWIGFLGAYFYINMVNQFKLNKVDSTFVELVRLS